VEGTSWQEVQRRTLTGQRTDINLLPFCNSMAQLSSRRPCRNISLTRAGYYCYRWAKEHAKEEEIDNRTLKTKSENGVLTSDVLLPANWRRWNNGDRIKCRSSLNFQVFGADAQWTLLSGSGGDHPEQKIIKVWRWSRRSRVSTNRRMENVKDTTNWISSRPIEKSRFGKSTSVELTTLNTIW
jgi:hypothetical protein